MIIYYYLLFMNHVLLLVTNIKNIHFTEHIPKLFVYKSTQTQLFIYYYSFFKYIYVFMYSFCIYKNIYISKYKSTSHIFPYPHSWAHEYKLVYYFILYIFVNTFLKIYNYNIEVRVTVFGMNTLSIIVRNWGNYLKHIYIYIYIFL